MPGWRGRGLIPARFGPSCLALLGALALAACQPLPKPFQTEHSPPIPGELLAPGPDAGLTVVPVVGAPAAVARTLPDLVAEGLRKRDITASSRSAQGDYLVRGEAAEQPQAGGISRVTLRWTLVGPTGLSQGSTAQTASLPSAAWQAGDRKTLAVVAGTAAIEIERLVRGGDSGRGSAPAADMSTAARVVVAGVHGAPGDGDAALKRAIGAVLRLKGIPVAPSGEPGGYQLSAEVKMAPAGGQEIVEIAWVLKDGDGGTLGTVSQRNSVPKGRLDGPWGDIAYLAAMGAADGLMQVLRPGGHAR